MRIFAILSTLLLFFSSLVFTQAVEETVVVKASDHGWDGGDKIDLEWKVPLGVAEKVEIFKIYRSNSEDEITSIIKDEISKAVKDAKEAVTKRLFDNAERDGVSKDDKGLLQKIRDDRKKATDNASQDLSLREDEIREKIKDPFYKCPFKTGALAHPGY